MTLASGGSRAAAPPTSPTGRVMRADARRNRENLLAAARAVFAEEPRTASMDDVAKRAGVGIATLFRNFPRRLDLIEAIYQEDLLTLAALAEELTETHEPWEALVAWLHAFVDFSEAKRTIITEITQAFDHDSEGAQLTRDNIDAAVSTVLVPALRAGVVDPDLKPQDIIQLIGGMVLSLVADQSRNAYLLGLLLRGIRAPGR